MTCNDILFNILYGSDIRLVKDMLVGSLDRLEQRWIVDDWDLQYSKVMFFLLLDVDIDMKNTICKGMCGMDPLEPLKAQAFFLALRGEIIEPFLKDSTMSKDDFMDNVKNLYLVS